MAEPHSSAIGAVAGAAAAAPAALFQLAETLTP